MSSRRCSRTGCKRPALYTLTYVYRESTAVLGPLAAYTEPHCYDLCEGHAGRLTAPLGWDVVRLPVHVEEQVPASAGANKPRVLEFIRFLDGELRNRPFVAGDAFTVADVTGLVSIDFMKPAKLAVPDELEHFKRWHAEVSARPSASA